MSHDQARSKVDNQQLLALRLIPDRCPTPSAAPYQFAADGAGPIDQYALICSGL